MCLMGVVGCTLIIRTAVPTMLYRQTNGIGSIRKSIVRHIQESGLLIGNKIDRLKNKLFRSENNIEIGAQKLRDRSLYLFGEGELQKLCQVVLIKIGGRLKKEVSINQIDKFLGGNVDKIKNLCYLINQTGDAGRIIICSRVYEYMFQKINKMNASNAIGEFYEDEVSEDEELKEFVNKIIYPKTYYDENEECADKCIQLMKCEVNVATQWGSELINQFIEECIKR